MKRMGIAASKTLKKAFLNGTAKHFVKNGYLLFDELVFETQPQALIHFYKNGMLLATIFVEHYIEGATITLHKIKGKTKLSLV